MITRRNILVLGGIGLLSSCVTSAPEKGVVGSTKDVTAEALPLVNALRAQYGLPPLQISRGAQKAAIFQAERMARAQKMAHNIGLTPSFFERMKADDVPLPAAENIATGQTTTSSVVSAWINSKNHLDNMLGRYNGLGVAVAYDATAGNRPYWAMILSAG